MVIFKTNQEGRRESERRVGGGMTNLKWQHLIEYLLGTLR